MFTSALGCLGAALSMTLPWPQVWRSCVGRRTTGLSAATCWLGVAMPIGWITYGLLIGDRLQVVSNTVTGAAGVAVLVALLVTQPSLCSRRALAGSAAGAIGVLTAAGVAALFGGRPAASALGGVLAVTAILAAVPQPLSLLRDRTQDLSGLSPLRWRLAAGAGAAWFVYGLATAQPGVWLSASATLTSAVIVSAVLFTRRPSLIVAPTPAAVLTPARVPARPSVLVRRSVSAGPSVLTPAWAAAGAYVPVPTSVPARRSDVAQGSVPARSSAPAWSSVPARPSVPARGSVPASASSLARASVPAPASVGDPAFAPALASAPASARTSALAPAFMASAVVLARAVVPVAAPTREPIPVSAGRSGAYVRDRSDFPTLIIPAHWLGERELVAA